MNLQKVVPGVGHGGWLFAVAIGVGGMALGMCQT